MEIVEVAADDVELRELVADQQAELSRRYGGGDDEVRESPQPPLSASARWLVVRVSGAAVGCVAVQPLDPQHGQTGTGEVKRLYVAPASRGQGLSKALMAAAEDLARAMGFAGLWLETGTAQPEAMGLYSTTGWSPIPPYGHWRDSPASRAFAKVLSG